MALGRRALTVPRIDVDRLSIEEVSVLIEDWINAHFVPVAAHEFHTTDDVPDQPESSTDTAINIIHEYFGRWLDSQQVAAVATNLGSAQAYRQSGDIQQRPSIADGGGGWEEANSDPLNGRDPSDVVEAAHKKMLESIFALEEILKQIAPISSKIGSNFPPEEIGTPPYTDADDREVIGAISILRSQPATPLTISSKVEDAAEILEAAGTKITSYVLQLGDVAARKFAESVGKSTGTLVGAGIGGLTLWTLLGERFLAAAQAVGHWVDAIRLLL